ncbi:MAG: TonB-dependent receptor [Candidatus Symbiothrix sp.]|jgi:iron complex outermembrane receptor protein|nr:TonB-dependent receptor [Candidatus Symbiothrix sp.]
MKQKQFVNRQAYRFRKFVQKSYAAFNSMHKVVNIGVMSGCMLTFAHATETAAQNPMATTRDSIPEQAIEEVVILSSKAELTLNQTAKIVTVITREEIARQPVESLQDLLKNVVGLDVRQRGSNGVLAGISVRGGTFEQTAILLNGANITNPQTGHYNLDLPVNLSDIERIEIIQGPASLLYGAGAFSGGVNIVTKKDADTGIYLNAEGGMHALGGANVRGSLKTESSNHSISAGYASSDGYINNSDYKLFNALWQSNFRTDASALDIQFGLNDKAYGANTFYSAAYPNQFDDTRSLFAAIKGESGSKLKFTPQVYWNKHYDHYQLTKNQTAGENYHQTDVFGFNLNAQYKWKGGITNFGGELRNEGIFSSNLGKDSIYNRGNYKLTDNRTNISYFLEHTYLYKQLTLSLGILVNYNTAFKDDAGWYPHINASYWVSKHVKAFANWSNATRMPTFTDLYYKGATHKGNSDVRPETSESFDLGVSYTHSFLSASVNGFYMKGTNLIDWVKEQPEDKWESRNFTRLNKTGMETNLSLSFKEWIPQLSTTRLDLGFMYLKQSKDAGNLISNYVMDYVRNKFTAGLSHPVYKGVSMDWRFRRVDRAGDYIPYSMLDAKLNWKIKDGSVYLTVTNLLDASYSDLWHVPQAGRWIIGGVAYAL